MHLISQVSIKIILDIKEVFFGANNDKFGGNGSVIDTSKMNPN